MAQEYEDYYGDNYSKYPTDDKKYECRTGPFEGFFVGSVEFCKFKFDDKGRKDNRTGTQGPPGATGPAGPQGIQGVPGISRFTRCNRSNWRNWSSRSSCNQWSINLYEVFGENVTEGSISIARCDLGDVVFDGGFNVVNFSTGAATIDPLRDQLESFGPNINNQYSVILSSNDPTLTYHTKAFCFDNPPLKP